MWPFNGGRYADNYGVHNMGKSLISIRNSRFANSQLSIDKTFPNAFELCQSNATSGLVRQFAPFEDTQKGTTNPFLIFLVSAFDSPKLRVLGKSMKTFGDL